MRSIDLLSQVFEAFPQTDALKLLIYFPGWITGHTYVTYGPLLNGATSIIFEGTPFHPTNDRFWEVIEKYKVSKFYTAPTAIR
jgi:acyl-coenzyme A synthetase/AMP-(fatty) acid ligase